MEHASFQKRSTGIFDLFYRILDLINAQDEDRSLFPGVGIGVFDIEARVTQNFCEFIESAGLIFHMYRNHICKCDIEAQRLQLVMSVFGVIYQRPHDAETGCLRDTINARILIFSSPRA